MITLLSHTAHYTRAAAGVAAQRWRRNHAELSWGQIVAGLLLLVVLWVFQKQFADFFHYLFNTFFGALDQGDRGTGHHTKTPRLGDGHGRAIHEPGDTTTTSTTGKGH